MKDILFRCGFLFSLFLVGCASKPVVLSPVGPNPSGLVGTSATGQLEVFSATEKCRDGNEFDVNPAWYQHTDYTIYDRQGKRMRHVFNTVGHYDEAPRIISLPPGRYQVKASAKDYLEVVVPVIIEAGRTTRVHLDDEWNLSVDIPKNELVSTPGGYPVGWRTNPNQHVGMN